MRSDIFAALLGSAIVCVAPAAAASPTIFTYQGRQLIKKVSLLAHFGIKRL